MLPKCAGTPVARCGVMKLITYGVAAFILTFCIPKQGTGQNVYPNRERAIALWEEAVRAKGGRERLHSVQSFVISSTVDVWTQRDKNWATSTKILRDSSQPGQTSPIYSSADAAASYARDGETQTERLYVGPGKAWIYTYTPAFDVSLDATLIDIDENRCWVTLAPKTYGVPGISRCIPATQIQYLLEDPIIYLMETKWLRPHLIGARTEGKGKNKLDVVETKVGSIRIDFYLDPKTRLPIKLVTDWIGGRTQPLGNLGPMTIELRKYVEIDGIQMPTKVIRERDSESRPVGEPFRLDTERAAYQFNVNYNPEIFEYPIPKNVKRRDWKL